MFRMRPGAKEELNNALLEVLDALTEAIYTEATRIIETERYWADWTTSDPNRDIVDTNALNKSGQIIELSKYKRRIRYATEYVIYVYFGHLTPSGARIPPRMWLHLAIDENEQMLLDLIVSTFQSAVA